MNVGEKISLKKSSAPLAIMALGALLSCVSAQAFAQSEPQGLPVPASPFGEAAAEEQSALPGGEGVNPRAPGLQLPADSGAGAGSSNPFASAGPVEVQKSPEQIEAEIRSKAFNAAITGLIPLNPDEIRKLLERYDQTRQAVETPVYPYPKPEIVTEDISLDPGSLPPVLKLATGHVTTVHFVDASGAPWPIMDINWAGNFEVIKTEPGGARLTVSPMSEFAYGNMIVQLLGAKASVSFTLETQREKVYHRFDARLPEDGPNAKPSLIAAGGLGLNAGGGVLNAVLEGVPPQGSEKLQVDGVDGRTTAYALSKIIYVRTPLTLLSPSWTASVSSADGMNVYSLKNASVLLLSDKGEVVRARLSERDFTHDKQ